MDLLLRAGGGHKHKQQRQRQLPHLQPASSGLVASVASLRSVGALAAATLATAATAAASAAAAADPSGGPQVHASQVLVQAHQHHFNGHDNGPILYTDPNRTSAIDDIRSVVVYIFIFAAFLAFFLILPGIRSEKLPTFFCVTTSLLVSSIIVIGLLGTTWHVAEAPISAAYKAFSRDRIQGDLAVRIGLHSVNISLQAHKYYILHHTDGPMMMENAPATHMLMGMGVGKSQPAVSLSNPSSSSSASRDTNIVSDASTLWPVGSENSAPGSQFVAPPKSSAGQEESRKLADELLVGRTADGIPVDTELESDEVFPGPKVDGQSTASRRKSRRATRSSSGSSSASSSTPVSNNNNNDDDDNNSSRGSFKNETAASNTSSSPVFESSDLKSKQPLHKYTIKRVHVDINYNERFYWIGPVQMRHEYHQALERGLPFPILTVVEYLSQDEAGFNWSRQYRAAGYYTSMCLWLSASVCMLMFCLHCAAPKYGIYAMQCLGCLLLFTNLTYATLVPRGDHRLVIPFEGQSLAFRFGWNFWLVLAGGCLSLLVSTIIVIIDSLFPNFIFTTVLDVDFDSAHQDYRQRKHKILGKLSTGENDEDNQSARYQDDDQGHKVDREADGDKSSRVVLHEKPRLPPFISESQLKNRRPSSGSKSVSPMTSSMGTSDGSSSLVKSATLADSRALFKHQLSHSRVDSNYDKVRSRADIRDYHNIASKSDNTTTTKRVSSVSPDST